jgi:dihydrofolate reductase
MGKVVVDMTMSVDGAVAGPSGLPEAGIHDWYFAPSEVSQQVIQQLIDTTGAIVMGRRAYDLGVEAGGYDDDPYDVTYFVLTHEPPAEPPVTKAQFVFVTDGPDSAVKQAQVAAGDRNVVIAGGAQTAQEFLRAGLVDEVRLALRPVVIPGGVRLFDTLEPGRLRLEGTAATWTPEATHLVYRVVR